MRSRSPSRSRGRKSLARPQQMDLADDVAFHGRPEVAPVEGGRAGHEQQMFAAPEDDAARPVRHRPPRGVAIEPASDLDIVHRDTGTGRANADRTSTRLNSSH